MFLIFRKDGKTEFFLWDVEELMYVLNNFKKDDLEIIVEGFVLDNIYNIMISRSNRSSSKLHGKCKKLLCLGTNTMQRKCTNV